MQQHLLLLSTLTVLVNASPRWGTTSSSQWGIDIHNNNVTYSSQNESDELLGNRNNNKNKGDFMGFSNMMMMNNNHKVKERLLGSSSQHRKLQFDDDAYAIRGRRGTKRSSSYDNIFDHGGYYGKSGSSSYYSSYSKSSKKSGKGSWKGGWYDNNDDDGNGNGGGGGEVTPPPTPQPTMATTTQPPTSLTMPPTPPPTAPTTPAPTTRFVETPVPTQDPPRGTPSPPPTPPPTPFPVGRPTPSPTAEATARNCVVNREGLFGAQIGVAEVIPFAYEIDVFGSPTTEQLISMTSAMEEGISNAIIPDLFAACSSDGTSSSSSSWTNQKEIPTKDKDDPGQREHHHVGSGLFPSITTTAAGTTTTFRSEEDRHHGHAGGGGSFTTRASNQWDASDRIHRHSRNNDGKRYLQQTRLTGLSSRPKDVTVNAACSGAGLGFQCVPVNAQLTVYSQAKLDQFTILLIEESIQRVVSTGGLDRLDNRIYRVNYRDLDVNPFPDSIDEDTPSPTLSPTKRFVPPQPQGEESTSPLPLWAIIAISIAGALLLIVLFVIWCLRRKNNMQYANSLSNDNLNNSINNSGRQSRPGDKYKPPPASLNNNAFGRPGGPRPPPKGTRPEGNPSADSFPKPNPHPSNEFGRPNPHPSPFRAPKQRLEVGQNQGGRQSRPGATRPTVGPPLASNQNNQKPTPPRAPANPTGQKPPPPRPSSNPTGQRPTPPKVPSNSSGQKPISKSSFGDKSSDAAAARKAAYGLGPIKSPAASKASTIDVPPIPTGDSLFSGVSGDKRKPVTSSQSVGGDPQKAGPNDSSHKPRPISSANSVSGYSATGTNPSVMSGFDIEVSSGTEVESGIEIGSDSEESEENISLTSSERRKSTRFGDPDNAFGDPDNAFNIATSRNSLALADRYASSSSSYEEEVEEEYEIEYVEEDEEEEVGGFQSSSADEDFWDDEVVEEVVDDPDQPILGGWTSSS